ETEVARAKEGAFWIEKRRTTYGYDTLAQLQQVSYPGGASVDYTYDPDGRISSIRDETHAQPNTTYSYDPAGRLAKVTQTLITASGGHVDTQYAYDTQGNLISVTDPNDNVTSYDYD